MSRDINDFNQSSIGEIIIRGLSSKTEPLKERRVQGRIVGESISNQIGRGR